MTKIKHKQTILLSYSQAIELNAIKIFLFLGPATSHNSNTKKGLG